MRNSKTDVQIQQDDNEIDLRELWRVLWDNWVILFISIIACAVVMATLGWRTPNIYLATALLAPSEESHGGGIQALAGQLGGIGSLAGFKFGNRNDSKIILALEVIKSRRFAENIIQKYDLMVPLLAVKGWNSESRELLIDSQQYDSVKGEWLSKERDDLQSSYPSMWDAYKAFSERLTIEQDKSTGFVMISIEHFSPFVAKQWVDIIVDEINLFIRQRDIAEASKSIDYLNKQLELTSLASMKMVFYQLIEEQSKTVMLAEVKDEYIFSTIDPAVIPQEKYKPNRILYVVFGLVLGFFVAVFLIFSRFLWIKNRI